MNDRPMNRDPRERVISAMFRPPVLQFSRMIRSEVDNNPEYLNEHESELFRKTEQLLHEAGITVRDLVTETELRHVLREVVVRLRSYEKGRV